MLNLNSKMILQGIELYRDFDDLDVFFYMPTLPYIAETADNNGPAFNVFAYRKSGDDGEEKAGGFLTMTTSCAIGNRHQRVLSDLKRKFGDSVRLVPVSFNSGTAELIALDAPKEGEIDEQVTDPTAIQFIEKLEASQTPMLSGAYQAFFSATLSEDGVSFLKGILEQTTNANPFGVRYDMKFTGLMPVQDIIIEIDFERSYTFLREQIGLNSVVLDTEISNVVEQLKTSESIKIQDTVRSLELSTPEAVKQRQTRIDNLVKELALGSLFVPTLTVGRPTVDENQTFGPVSGGRAISISDGLRSAGPSGGVGAALTQAHLPDMPRRPNGRTVAAPQEAPSGNASTNAARDAMAAVRATYVMRNLSQSERRTVRYEFNRTIAMEQPYTVINGLAVMGTPVELRNRIVEINLSNDFFKRFDISVGASTMDFDQEGVSQLIVDLRYGKEADGDVLESRSVVLNNPTDNQSFTFFRDEAQTDFYEYRITALFDPDSALGRDDLRVIGPWVKTDARSLIAHSDMIARTTNLDVRLDENMADTIDKVDVTLTYFEGNTSLDSLAVQLNKTSPQHVLKTRFTSADARLEAEAVIRLSDGSEIKHDLMAANRVLPNTAPTSLVVPLPKTSNLNFDVILQDPLETITSVILDYELSVESQTLVSKSIEISEALRPVRISEGLPDPDVHPVLKYRERRLMDSGGLQTFDWTDATQRSITVGIPAADVKTVNFRYLGPPLESLGIGGVLVDLSYESSDEDPEFSQKDSLFIDAATPQSWKIRLKDRADETYHYTISMFMNDGTKLEGEAVSSNRDNIIIQPKI